MQTVARYLSKKTGSNYVQIPGVEAFKNSRESGYGIRFVESGSTRCIRFNWSSEGAVGQLTAIDSIDIFNGKSHDPSLNISVDSISLSQVLPYVAEVLMNPKTGSRLVFPVDMKEAIAESVLYEVARDHYTTQSALQSFLTRMKSGQSFTRTEFMNEYHSVHAGIYDIIKSNFQNSFIIDSRRIALDADADIVKLEKEVLAKSSTMNVVSGGSKESYKATAAETQLEKAHRVSYEDTLEHLSSLVGALTSGAFNALFVAGPGGTGKTQTVENVLNENGLYDGDGYFKNTGSASAAGVYTLLYHHRDDIVLFDDSDGALADQDARNLIKAATDTKKNRKLVWNKKSSFIYDPDSSDAEDYEDDMTMAPKYFDFTGRIIFISNLPLAKLDPDGALRTRAFVVNVDPTKEEMYDFMEKILDDVKLEEGLSLSSSKRKEVLEVVKQSKRVKDVSLRKLVRALNLAASGVSNWKALVDLYA